MRGPLEVTTRVRLSQRLLALPAFPFREARPPGGFGLWTERAGPDVALRIVSGIIETILLPSQQQRMGRAVEEFGAGVRRFPSGRYVIYYRVSRGRVQVLHVFHGSRDQRKAWNS
jgi:plasmid stabilization system protein ParE